MERFIARQPIFDRRKKVYAYELLFRSGLENFFDGTDGDAASSRVISDSSLLFGLETMVGDAKAFINFTRNLLLEDSFAFLPRQQLVVEVLEDVEPDPEVIAACQRLKKKGYSLALDDFIYDPKFVPLLALADIIKVDFLQTGAQGRAKLAELFAPRGIRMLAEKVESEEEFKQGLEMGYTLFQGYFFSKPVLISRQELPSSKLHHLRMLKEINRPEMSFDRLGRVISNDVSISYKLLRYINSPYFGVRNEVTSIPQALALLGEDEVRKWASLIALSGVGEDKPAEVLVTCLVRAKFCEQVAERAGEMEQSSDYFLMGLFSLLDTLCGRPLDEVLEELPLPDHIRGALLGAQGRPATVMGLIKAYEQGDWQMVGQAAKQLRISQESIPKMYLDAVGMTRDILQG